MWKLKIYFWLYEIPIKLIFVEVTVIVKVVFRGLALYING